MTRQLFFGLCLSTALGLGCNQSLIEGGECEPGARGCDPGPDPVVGTGPDRTDKVGPGTGTDFDPNADGSSGVKKDPSGNVVLDPGNLGSLTPVIWVANSAEGTVSKFDTRTLKEMARYMTYPGGSADPSRTTVSRDGDVVVANRCASNCPSPNRASALKIAGDVSGCVDRNKNGKIDTGAGAAVIPWPAGQKDSPDECVLWLTDLSDGGNQTLPRAAGFDLGTGELGTNVYIGLFNKQEVVRINPATGAIVKRIDVKPAHPYGIVVDQDNTVWVQGASELMRVDVKGGDAVKNFGSSPCAYGITADNKGNIYTAGSTCVARLNPATGMFQTVQVPGATFLRGIALDQKNTAWTSDTSNGMYKIDAAGANMAVQGSVMVSGGGIGAAIDFDNNPWIISQTTATAYKVNPANLTATPVKVGNGPYTYSDMTGYQLRNVAPTGVYRRTFPGCGEQTRWFDLNYEIQAPTGSEVTVRVRFAATQAALAMAPWVQVAKVPSDKPPVRLAVPAGARPDFLQVEISMKSADAKITPILSALSVGYSCNILG